ncbi:MAG: glycosyltransferase family 9 protein [Fusobacteriaceae bacterium]
MKILLVRFRQIGDALLSSVLCNSLKKSFPDSQIDYVVYDFITPLFENHPYIDNVISITSEERKNPFKYFMKTWKITRTKYDIVIDLMGTPKSELFTLLSPNAKFRIGPYGSKKKIFRGNTYTHGVYEPKNAIDQCDKFLKLLTPLKEAKYNIIYDHNFVLGLTSHEKIIMNKKMVDSGIDFSKKVFAFAVNSRRPEKVYPIENMKKLVTLTLNKYPDCQIVLFYSPDEKEFIKNFHEELKNNIRIFSNIQTKSIRELATLISQCDLFIGNEGGPRHLAQAINLPSLSIWRHGIRKDWLPNKSDWNRGISTEDFKDTIPNYDELNQWEKYALITPEKVLEEIIDMVNKYVKK